MAVDLGDKRTGIAVGDHITGIVTPIEVLQIPASDDGGERLLAAIETASIAHLGARPSGKSGPRGEIIVGLPLNMDGTEGAGAKKAREFGTRIAARTGRDVRFMDERLSSAQAEWELNGSGLTRGQKKDRRDALAAAAILREFLDAKRGEAGQDGVGP
jgi:putative Holliday junction resolvase